MEEDSNSARYAFKKNAVQWVLFFLSALAASLYHRHVGSGGMSDARLTRGMRGFTKELRGRRMPVMCPEAKQPMAGDVSECLSGFHRAATEHAERSGGFKGPAHSKKRCTGFPGGLNAIPENPHASEFLYPFLWCTAARPHRKGPRGNARSFSRVRSSAPQPVPPFMPTPRVRYAQALISRV